ncbi:amino acid adenylation domain-containing protein [Streptosporangiaceae bacterium NEAU-GS5]|nr:amino acid adenylation domain-containing protein [Streptosporangiaceae bacterium NEAU-GS5]
MSYALGGAPLSLTQQGIWVSERQGGTATSAFHMPLAIWFEGTLDVPALSRACASVLDRHPLLATAVRDVAGAPVLAPAAAEPQVRFEDLTGESADRTAGRVLSREIAEPFDLDKGPLCRFMLARTAPDRHVLLFVAHHLVFDGMSKDVLVRDLAAFYEGATLDPLPLSFGDAVSAQLERVAQALPEAGAFWRERWREPQELVLPLQERGTRFAAPGEAVELQIPYDDVAATARKLGATSFEVLLAAVHTLLYRYGSDDVAVAVDLSTRTPETSDHIGPFISELPVFSRPRAEQTFHDFTRGLRAELRATYRFREVPLARAVAGLTPRAALTPVSVSYRRRAPEPSFRGVSSHVEWMMFNGGVRDALHVQFVEGPDDLLLSVQFNPAAVARETAAAVAGHLLTLLRSVAADPGVRLGELDILTPAERHRMLVEWNATDEPYKETTLPRLFAARAKQRPDAVAVAFEGTTLTYAELDAASNRLARRLAAEGAAGELVAVHLDPSEATLVALLGILKAGAAYLPLDPALPAERLALITGDARPQLLITDRPLDLPVRQIGAAAAGDGSAYDQSDPRGLAYVIYTSGSTGRPKGVEVGHQALTNLLLGLRDRLQCGPDDVWLALTSLSFDIAALELYLPLVVGGRVVVAPEGAERRPSALARLVEEQGVTHVQATPSGWRLLLPGGIPGPGITALAGGEALPPSLAGELAARAGRLINVYGPTETTIWSALAEPSGDGPVTIGRPIANTRIHVLDEESRLVPTGVAGELCIGGAGLARGYRERPGLTADRFVPDPFGPPGARLYRTGDRARFRHDGEIEFLGRWDDQIKLRGHRIELGEIEARLQEHPDVGLAAVVLLGSEDPRLVAYVTGHADPAELRRHLAGKLPAVMVPGEYVVLDELPLTPNGKLDRRALPEPARTPSSAPAPQPGSELADTVREIWCEVLARDDVGLDDDLFDLGGHSITITQISARIHERLGVEVSLDVFFENPTVVGVVEAIETAEPDTPFLEAAPTRLSYGQERLWFLQQFDPGDASWNLFLVRRLRGELDVARLQMALDIVVARHDSLRTSFTNDDGTPVAVIHPPAHLPFERLSLSEDQATQVVSERVNTPFDLAAVAPLRATLIELGPDDHVLCLVMHHIIGDGWSLNVLFDDLATAYQGQALPPLPWRREEPRERAESVDYWRTRLADPPVLDLPVDRREPSGVGAFHMFRVPVEVAHAVEAIARGRGATLFMALLAAYQTLLARHTAQDDVLVGTPWAARDRVELERVAGYLTDTLILRGDLAGDPSFAALLDRTRQSVLDAHAHRDVPFERLIGEFDLPRDLDRNPLLPTMLILNGAETDVATRSDFAGLPAELFDSGYRGAKFDLALEAWRDDDGLLFSFSYDIGVFDAATVRRIGDRFETLLASIAADPETRLSALPLLPLVELEELAYWNQTGEPAFDDTVPELFLRQAAQHPDAPAVVCGDQTLTYADLLARATGIASELRLAGAGPGTLVAVVADRSAGRGADTVAAVLGVMLSGAGYLPVDPAYPAARIAYMLEDSGATLALAHRDHLAGIPGDVTTLVLGEISDDSGELALPEPDDVAYVLYTSGSTGRPKGVVISHRALMAFLDAMDELLTPSDGDVWLGLTSLSFDISALELYLPLISGASVVMAGGEITRDGTELARLVGGAGVTHVQATPSGWRMLLDGGIDGARLVALAGGEALPPPLARELRARVGRLINMYGPTETTIWSATWEVPPDPGRVLIGAPITGTTCHVLDASGGLAPAGVPGELAIGGAGVAIGYLGAPGLTAERFVPDPYGPPGARMYRTGDRVRRLLDGRLEFLGRLDGQVKIHGHRIEPGEIESLLLEHPAVDQAAVVVRGARIIAYATGSAEADDLREHLAGQLPQHMIPAAYVLLAELPLTPNGKLDRRALPEPDQTASDQGEPPRTRTEVLTADVYAEVLGVGRVAATDDFFALGGHSLLATKAVARLSAALGAPVPVRELFANPSVRGLAAAVEAMPEAGVALAPRAPGTNPPLSYAQERLWFLNRLDPDDASYNMFYVLRLRGPLDRDALTQALDKVVARHESLRTCFTDVDGAPVTVIRPPAHLPIEHLTLSEDQARELVADRVNAPFDLAAAPPLRATLIELGPDDHVLCLVMHHIIGDGWSLNVLFDDLAAYYQGRTPQPLPVQAGDVALWRRVGDSGDDGLDYWRRQLADPPILDLASDQREPSGEGAFHFFRVPAEVAGALEEAARGRGATLFMALMAAYQAWLGRHAGQDDVLVGTPWAARDRVELEPIIAYLTDTIVLRGDLRGDPSFGELLDRTRRTVLDALAHYDVPFERLVGELGLSRDVHRNALLPTLMILHSEAEGPPRDRLGDLAVDFFDDGYRQAKFDLMLEVWRDEEGLRCILGYETGLFDEETARTLAERFTAFLRHATADPDAPLSTVPMLTEADLATLATWGRSPRPAAAASVPELIAAAVARDPGATAVVCGTERLTYAQLDARAGRLAGALRDHGVRPGDMVGVCLPRSLEMIVALLAVWRAGGAYVPLDPEYPDERLAFLISDAGARIVVTTRPLPVDVVSVSPDATGDPVTDRGEAAYVIHTSGSTGTPKGVVVDHEALAHRVQWMREAYRLQPADQVVQFASLSFDAHAEEVFPALAAGASLLLLPDGAATLPDVLRAPEGRDVTVLDLPTAYWHRLAEMADELTWPAGLRLVILGGEQAHAAAVARWRELFGGRVRLVNTYGPTEATIIATAADLGEADTTGRPPIGRPIGSAVAYVLDEHGRLAPPGTPGELCLGGPGLARGYLGRPGRTAERFTPDPYGEPGARLYRTGDRARWRRDGQLEFLGRLDDQVKVRGFRVEPGEVAAAILTHPTVREAAVVASAALPENLRPAAEVSDILVAYVATPELDADELRRHLSGTLPQHMVPTLWVRVDALPLTVGGKVDLAALPAPAPAPAVVHIAPRGDAEHLVASVWAEVLRIDQDTIGALDDFFALGGHSLLATRVTARLRSAIDADVTIRMVFDHPTVEQLAAAVEELLIAELAGLSEEDALRLLDAP